MRDGRARDHETKAGVCVCVCVSESLKECGYYVHSWHLSADLVLFMRSRQGEVKEKENIRL